MKYTKKTNKEPMSETESEASRQTSVNKDRDKAEKTTGRAETEQRHCAGFQTQQGDQLTHAMHTCMQV